MKLGIIDLGSNNIRFAVWEIYGNGYYRMIDELKENVRMGADTDNPFILDNKIDAAIDTLKRFKKFSESLDVGRIVIVGTEALRRAPNREEILKRIEEETGFNTIVLSEYEEAYLVYKGVVGSMVVKNSLMIDIGGTSTELVWIKDGELIESTSIPIGTLTLTEKFGLENIISPHNHTAMEKTLLEEFDKIPWLKGSGFQRLICVGGSARTIGRIDRHKKRYPISVTHNYSLNDIDLNQLYFTMLTKDAHMRAKIDGLEKDRSDIILGALAITSTVLKITGLQELRISGKGLREGILFEHLSSNYDRIENMLDAAIYSILARHDMDVAHAEHVYSLTYRMFKSLQELSKVDDSYLDILKTASMLHDVGMSITYYDHEKHSFYIILNSELNGINHKEILIAAFTAKFHKKYNSSMHISAFSGMINKLDISIAEKMGILIALSESFDRNLSGKVFDVKCEFNDDEVIIMPYSHEDISTEVMEAMKVEDSFEEIYKRKIVIKPMIV